MRTPPSDAAPGTPTRRSRWPAFRLGRPGSTTPIAAKLLIETLEPRILLSADLDLLGTTILHARHALLAPVPMPVVVVPAGRTRTPSPDIAPEASAESWSGGSSGAWDVAGNWSGGVVPDATTDVSIAGKVTVSLATDAAHGLTLSGGVTLSGGSLSTAAAASSDGSSLVSTVLSPEAGLTLTGTNTLTVTSISAAGGSVLNQGTLRFAGTATQTVAGTITNSGTIDVTSGTLAFSNGQMTSTKGAAVTVSAGATLDLTGGGAETYAGTLTATGAGTIALSSGTLTADATAGFTIDAAGALFQWTGGAIQATGTSFTNTGTITLSGTGTQSLGGTLDNAGTMVQTGSQFDLNYGTYSNDYGGTLVNDGSFRIDGDGSIGGSGPIDNSGSFTKSAGTGTSLVNVDFDDDGGSVAVDSGTLELVGGTETDAAFQTTSGSTLLLTGPYENTYTFSGTVAGTGAGTITFDNIGATVGASGASFDFAPSELQWIDGQFAAGGAGLTNTGAITFSNASATTVVQLAGLFDNRGTIEDRGAIAANQSTGGIATITNDIGAVFELTNDATLAGGATFQNDGLLSMVSGTASSIGITALNLNADGTVAVDAGTLTLDSAGTDSGQTFSLAAGTALDLSNTSFVGVQSSTGAGTIDFGGGATGAGGATFDFAPGILSWTTGVIDARLGTLTNAGSLALSGADTKQFGGGDLVNTGTITQSGGSLQLEFETYTAFIGGVLDNGGTYGILDDGGISSGTIANTGTIQKTGGTATSTIDSDLNGSGTLSLQSGSVTLTGNLDLDGARLADLSGTLTLAYGSIANTSFQTTTLADGTQTAIDFTEGMTLTGTEDGTGTGQVLLAVGQTYTAGTGGATLDFAGGGLTFQGGLLDGGTGGFINKGLLTVSQVSTQSQYAGSLVNDGTIAIAGVSAFESNAGSLLTNMPDGVVDFQGDGGIYPHGDSGQMTFINEGVVRKSEGTLSEFEPGGYDGAGGTFDVEAGTLAIGNTENQGFSVLLDGTLTGSGPIEISGDLTADAAGATLDFAPGVADWTGGTISGGVLTNAGTLTLTGTAQHEFGGTVDNTGTIVQQGGYLGLDGAASGTVLNNSGLYDLQGDGVVTNNFQLGALFDNTGTLTRSAGTGTGSVDPNNFTNTGTVSAAAGTLDIATNGQLQNDTLTGGTWDASAGATLDLGTITTNDATVTLNGAGSMVAGLSELTSNQGTLSIADGAALAITDNLANGGTLSVGPSSTVSIGGDYSQAAGGTLATIIDGSPASRAFGTLAVGGNASLGGTYQATLATGFGAAPGNVYMPVSYASATGAFASIDVPTTLQATIGAQGITLAATSSGPDLATTAVTPETASAAPGQPVTVNYTVTNTGGSTASGSWTDSVYLSVNGALDPNDVLLGRVVHTGDLAAGASYSGQLIAALPPLPDGPYSVLVLSDSRDQVPDPNRANNLGASSAPVTAAIPVLPLGEALDATIASGQDAYYEVAAQPGADVSLAAAFAEAGDAQVYVGVGKLPTPSSFDQTDAAAGAAQSITLPGIAAGDVYVLVHGLAGAGAGKAFTLTASTTPLSITGLVSSTGGQNQTDAVIGVTGTQFTAATTVSLVAADGTVYGATSVSDVGPSTLSGTFDLSKVPVGEYTVMVQDGTETARSTTLYYVLSENYSTDVSQLDVSVSTPGQVLVGSAITAVATIKNPTDTPVLVSDFWIYGTNVTNPDQQVISPSSAVVIPAHGVFTRAAPMQFMPAPDGPGTLVGFAGVFMEPDNTPLDLTALSAELKPASVSQPAWDAIFQNLTTEIGTTQLSLYSVELKDDTVLQLDTGAPTLPSGNQALELELLKASDILPTPVINQTTDVSYPAPGLSLTFARSFQSSIEGRFSDGRLGQGWVDNWDYGATLDTTANVVSIQEGPVTRLFSINADGSFTASAGDTGTLTENGGAFRLTELDQTVAQFSTDGTLDYVQDANGNRITAGYTGGEMTSLASSDGDKLAIAYNANGTIASVTDPSGRTATYQYDSTGHELVAVTTAAGTVSYGYGSNITGPGAYELTSINEPGGSNVFFSYDDQGRLSKQEGDGGANPTTFAYGTDSYVATDANGDATGYFFDQTGQVFATADPLGHVVRASFDGSGDPTTVSSTGGGTTSITYETTGGGASSQTTDPAGGTITLSYTTGYAELTGETDQDGNVTSYGYNSNHDVTSATYADGSKATYGYATDGSVTQTVNRVGQTSTYTYDAQGLLLGVTASDGTSTTYTYDSHGDLLTATDAVGTITLSYDDAGRVLKVAYPDGRSLTFSYDATGRRVQSVDQDGVTTNDSYDAQGRLSELTDGSGVLIARYTYDAAGNLVRQDNGNGTYTTTSYDPDGNVLSIINYAPDGSINSRFAYAYDALGRVTSMATLTGTATYGYDADSRLIAATLPDGTIIDYSYDAAGNRTAVIENGATTGYTTNDLNEYVTIGGTVQTYDAGGNLVGGSGGTYTYNALGQLSSVTNGSGTWRYKYDALGDLSSETHDGQTTSYLVDPTGLHDVVAEYSTGGSLIADYTFGNGLASQTGPTGTDYYDFDAQGSTVGLSGANGSYVASYSYDPFGNVVSSSGDVANPYQYAGAYGVQTLGSGLDHMGARVYDPVTGRFTQPDPTGLLGGSNLYTYASDNSINLVDPTGLVPADTLVKIVDYGFAAYSTYDTVHGDLKTINDYGDTTAANVDLAGSLAVNSATDYLVAQQTVVPLVTEAGADGVATYALGQTGLGALNLEVQAILGSVGATSTLTATGLKTVAGFAASLAFFAIQKIIYTATMDILVDLDNFHHPVVSYSTTSNGASSTLVVSGPHDPNFIAGPSGYGSGQYIVGGGDGSYYVAFTNEPNAGAPARTVTVTEQLDPSLDLSTFSIGSFGFGTNSFSVPAGLQDYSTRIDDRAETGVFVDVAIHLDVATRTLTATYTSIDPTTLDDESDPFVGFLPPDKDDPMGTGWLAYTVATQAGLATGTKLTAQASVVFDTEAPVVTEAYVNTIDDDPPSSAVAALPAISPPAIPLTWSGSDGNGSGIASYDVFVSEDGGSYRPILVDTTSTSTIFQGVFDHSYSFYSTANDNVGLVEAPPASPDAITLVDTPPVAANLTASVSNLGPPITVAASYTDPDPGDTHSFTIGTAGTKGLVTNLGGGSFAYNPNGAFPMLMRGQTASDSFTYTVTDGEGLSSTATVDVTVLGQDVVPTASDIAGAVLNGGPAIALAAVYTDPIAGDVPVFTLDTGATKGLVSNAGDGHFTYAPNGAFAFLTLGQIATDSFAYTVTDGEGLSATATATITVTGQDSAPVASNVRATVASDGKPITIDAAYTDRDPGDTHSFSINTSGTRGLVTNNHNGSFTYDPSGAFAALKPGQAATDSFAYTVTDGEGLTSTATVTVTVTGASSSLVAYPDGPYNTTGYGLLLVDAAHGVLANDVDTSGGRPGARLVQGPADGLAILLPDGAFGYLADPGYSGTDGFTYEAVDGAAVSAPTRVTITVHDTIRLPFLNAAIADLATHGPASGNVAAFAPAAAISFSSATTLHGLANQPIAAPVVAPFAASAVSHQDGLDDVVDLEQIVIMADIPATGFTLETDGDANVPWMVSFVSDLGMPFADCIGSILVSL